MLLKYLEMVFLSTILPFSCANYRQRSLSWNQDLFKNCGRNETREFWSYKALKMALPTYITDVIRNEILNEKRSDGWTCDGNDFWIILTWFSLVISRSLKWVSHKCKRMSNVAFHLFICFSSTKSFLPVWSFLAVFFSQRRLYTGYPGGVLWPRESGNVRFKMAAIAGDYWRLQLILEL